MDVCVLSGDVMFYSAVEGVAGAMGHRARQVETLDEVGVPDLLIVDGFGAGVALSEVVATVDGLRVAVFAPHGQVDTFTQARSLGVAHMHRRGALAEKLPEILREYGG